MPHINDLNTNNVFEGVNGERWIVAGAVNSSDQMLITLNRLKVEEVLEDDFNKPLSEI